jgi:hypothetical protein
MFVHLSSILISRIEVAKNFTLTCDHHYYFYYLISISIWTFGKCPASCGCRLATSCALKRNEHKNDPRSIVSNTRINSSGNCINTPSDDSSQLRNTHAVKCVDSSWLCFLLISLLWSRCVASPFRMWGIFIGSSAAGFVAQLPWQRVSKTTQ